MRFKCLVGIAFCACLFGCDQAEVIKKCFLGCDQAKLMKILTPPDAESSARYYVDLLRQGKFDEIQRDMDPSIVDANLRDTLAKMAAIFPTDDPKSIKVVSVHRSNGKDYSKTEITLEYQFPRKWLLVSFATQNTRNMSGIVKFRVTPIADSLENIHKFTLVGKSAVQYSILMLGVCSQVLSFYALILCIRAKHVKRKWLWMLVVLVGVEKVAVNWETGQLTFGILSINFPFVVLGNHIPYGPWTIGVCIPLGAILFLRRQKKLRISAESIPLPVEDAK
jgi:hypothetical protein